MRLSLTRKFYFSAALKAGNATNCTGHNFCCEVEATGHWDAERGMLVNVREIKASLSEIFSCLDHKFLNEDVTHFRSHPPTLENVALYIFDQSARVLESQQLQILRLRLHQDENCFVEVSPP